ncbi:MAG: sugar ABC transporter substrate-binding protein [Betaproteobacteria bacterium]|nr:sugar ABC transporter substrate-binding protein [Betaproteobacteria bacterium]
MKLWLTALALAAALGSAHAQDFNWRKDAGTTITFLSSNHPWANSVLKYKDEFTKLTGITVKVDTYQEQQMRQRLMTVMNANSDEVDLFMSLPSREGAQFAKAGWYANLEPFITKDVSKDYDFGDFSKGLVAAETHGSLVSGIPLNIEGPVLYYRKDIFKKCGVTPPKSLDDLLSVAKKIKACDPSITPFVSRGLKGALPYTFSVFLHNMGGSYMTAQRKSDLCSAAGKAALTLYATLLRDYGPPGVVNYNFYQISSLYRDGKAAMAFESSNELKSVMEGGARLNDTGVMLLPPGPGGSHPTVIGWGISVSAHSKHKEAAWYFVQWATSPAMQARLALMGIAPPRASVANDPSYRKWIDAEPVRREWIDAIDQANATGTSEVGYPIVANIASRDYIGQAVDDLLLGQKPVQQACAEADRELDALIAKD